MIMFNDLYKKGNTVECICNIDGVYALAASDGNDSSVMICNSSGEDKTIEVELSGIKEGNGLVMQNCILSEDSDAELVKTEIFRGSVAIPVINLPKTSVVWLRIKGE